MSLGSDLNDPSFDKYKLGVRLIADPGRDVTREVIRDKCRLYAHQIKVHEKF